MWRTRAELAYTSALQASGFTSAIESTPGNGPNCQRTVRACLEWISEDARSEEPRRINSGALAPEGCCGARQPRRKFCPYRKSGRGSQNRTPLIAATRYLDVRPGRDSRRRSLHNCNQNQCSLCKKMWGALCPGSPQIGPRLRGGSKLCLGGDISGCV